MSVPGVGCGDLGPETYVLVRVQFQPTVYLTMKFTGVVAAWGEATLGVILGTNGVGLGVGVGFGVGVGVGVGVGTGVGFGVGTGVGFGVGTGVGVGVGVAVGVGVGVGVDTSGATTEGTALGVALVSGDGLADGDPSPITPPPAMDGVGVAAGVPDRSVDAACITVVAQVPPMMRARIR